VGARCTAGGHVAAVTRRRSPPLARDTLVGPVRRHRELVTDRPKAQQTDPELALDRCGPAGLQSALDRVADVRGHVAEIRAALAIARHPVTVVADGQEVPAMLAAARNRHHARLGIDAVFDELGDRLQRTALRQRDDGDGIPVVTNLQLAARWGRFLYGLLSAHIAQRYCVPSCQTA